MTQRILFSGEGINNKTGKPIKFRIPEAISDKGLENIFRNVKGTKVDGIMYQCELDRLSGGSIAIKDKTGKWKRFDPENIDLTAASPDEIRVALLWRYATSIPVDMRRFWDGLNPQGK